jgi:hypothetical protein
MFTKLHPSCCVSKRKDSDGTGSGEADIARHYLTGWESRKIRDVLWPMRNTLRETH